MTGLQDIKFGSTHRVIKAILFYSPRKTGYLRLQYITWHWGENRTPDASLKGRLNVVALTTRRCITGAAAHNINEWCSVTHANHNPEQTWNATPPMNAVFKLENPDVQNAVGAFLLPYPAAADAVHSGPFAHSHSIFSFLSYVKQLTEHCALPPENNEALYPL